MEVSSVREHSTYEISCVCGRLIHSETPTLTCQYCGRQVEIHWQQQDIPQEEITHAEVIAREIRRYVNRIREVERLRDKPPHRSAEAKGPDHAGDCVSEVCGRW